MQEAPWPDRVNARLRMQQDEIDDLKKENVDLKRQFDELKTLVNGMASRMRMDRANLP